MKWIDFDELEKIKGDEESEQLEEGWDGNFFAEFADKISEESEEDDSDYWAVPEEMKGANSREVEEEDEEAYLRIPEELRQQRVVELNQRQEIEKQEEAHLVVEKQEEDLYDMLADGEELSLEEKRSHIGRMLGLGVDRTSETVTNRDEHTVTKNVTDDETNTVTENMARQVQEFLSTVQISESKNATIEFQEEELDELPDVEEKEEWGVVEEPEKEPVYYDPLEFGEANAEEYQQFRESYIRRNILEIEDEEPKEQEIIEQYPSFVQEANSDYESTGSMDSLSGRLPTIDEILAQRMLNAGNALQGMSEQMQPRKEEQVSESDESLVIEEMSSVEAENYENEEEEESSFVDSEEFYRIEQEEQKRILRERKAETIDFELGEFEIDEDDFEEDESDFQEEESQLHEEISLREEEIQSHEKIPLREEEDQLQEEIPLREAEIQSHEEGQLQVENQLQETGAARGNNVSNRANVLNKANVSNRANIANAADATNTLQPRSLNTRDVSDLSRLGLDREVGVLKKRALPGREKRDIEKARAMYLKEANAESNPSNINDGEEKTVVKTSLNSVPSKKIDKLQSAFEEEYKDILQMDNLFRRRKKGYDHTRSKEAVRERRSRWEAEEKEPKKPMKEFLGWLISIVVVIVVTFVLVEYVGQRTEVSGASMEATLNDGDNLIVDKISYAFGEPERFDIVVFPYTPVNADKEVYYIKRIIGLPGETVQIVNGFIYINGEKLEESYGKDNALILNPGRAKQEILLGEDEYFVLGDNRNNSSDSREIGNINREDIVGRAWLRIWPLTDFGILKHQ